MWQPTTGTALAIAMLVSVTNADLERAISIGRSPDPERARFHARYIVPLNGPTVEQIEVLTEFRRAVLIVEDRAMAGNRMFGISQLAAVLRPFHNQVTIRARLRFHPQNALPAIPEYDLRVGDPADRLVALGPTARSPIYVSVSDDPTVSRALMGATVEISYDSGIVGQASYPVSVVLDRLTVASTRIDFAQLE